ncbi:MAG: hypothetical protein EBQ89_09635 [Alphaproteobacteria bacterium]|nr:hypothetical protein [Alphaproteobacteria bacterium]
MNNKGQFKILKICGKNIVSALQKKQCAMLLINRHNLAFTSKKPLTAKTKSISIFKNTEKNMVELKVVIG